MGIGRLSFEVGLVRPVLDAVGGGPDPLHDPDRELEASGC